jgi:hypothetical protein
MVICAPIIPAPRRSTDRTTVEQAGLSIKLGPISKNKTKREGGKEGRREEKEGRKDERKEGTHSASEGLD